MAEDRVEIIIGQCESCGRDDEEIVVVRRLYVTPEAWDTPQSVQRGELEQWCFVCRTHYPHEAPDAAPDAAPED